MMFRNSKITAAKKVGRRHCYGQAKTGKAEWRHGENVSRGNAPGKHSM
jgi:hypothetical protein